MIPCHADLHSHAVHFELQTSAPTSSRNIENTYLAGKADFVGVVQGLAGLLVILRLSHTLVDPRQIQVAFANLQLSFQLAASSGTEKPNTSLLEEES